MPILYSNPLKKVRHDTDACTEGPDVVALQSRVLLKPHEGGLLRGCFDSKDSLPDATVLDGEIVALDESEKPSFHLLQNASTVTPVTFFAFDLLMLEGQDLRDDRLDERRERLKAVVAGLPEAIRFSENVHPTAEAVIASVRQQGWRV